MAQYKAVPTTPVIQFTDFENDLPQKLQEYAEQITKESVGGWEFVGIYPFRASLMETGGFFSKAIKNKLSGRDLLDSEKEAFTTNMMLFKKE